MLEPDDSTNRPRSLLEPAITVLPNFLFIGPDKTGSSWLFEVLRQHPECFVPSCKDLYFFDRYYDRGLAWYGSFFAAAPPSAKAIGELSHDYLYSPIAAERIARDLPGVKLLTCLRDPAERCFSHYLYLVRSGLTRSSFRRALDEFPVLINHSLYCKHLSAYFDRVGRDRVHVSYFEDLQRDPVAFAARLFEFLGLAADSEIDFHRRVLPAAMPRSYWLARSAKLGAVVVRNLGLPSVVGAIKHSRLVGLLYKPFRERPRLDPLMRAELTRRFAEDTAALEALLGRDLASWRAA